MALSAHWRNSLHQPNYRSLYKEAHGEAAYKDAIAQAMRDEEIMALPGLREALQNPGAGTNALIVDFLLHPFDGPFWREHSAQDAKATIPAYLGACWGNYGLHLPGAFTAWRDWQGPKKMVIGPGVYLDRPVYQYQDESLRWFDHWLKGIDNGVMDEPPIRCFIPPTGEWKSLNDWPPPEARWTTFYLHKDGILSEHELWPGEGADSFDESNFEHGSVTYATPPLVENTEVLGPSVLTLYLSTTDTDALLFVTLLLIDREGKEHELTRGWLRASQRRLRDDSKPWEPIQAHEKREPLEPGKIYELKIPIVADGALVSSRRAHRDAHQGRRRRAAGEFACKPWRAIICAARARCASRFTTTSRTRRISICRSRAATSSALSFPAAISARLDSRIEG